jgi:hypothetical protein
MNQGFSSGADILIIVKKFLHNTTHLMFGVSLTLLSIPATGPCPDPDAHIPTPTYYLF